MGLNFSYDQVLPDYGDINNDTGDCPGYRVAVSEVDAGVVLEMEMLRPADGSLIGAFFNIEEANELVVALQESIARAERKDQGQRLHPRRVKPSF
jgi:hypothetical protein